MKITKKIFRCLLLLVVVFLNSCQNKTTYVSNSPISEIRKMQPVKIIIEQCIIREGNDEKENFYPNAQIIQTKQQAVQIIENPENWQPFMEYNEPEAIKNIQDAFTKSVKPLKKFNCVFAANKKISFIDKGGNIKWICFVNARPLKE
ncbi:MAG: hypothetical protein JW806_07060 [Sedimentisphaerales bacterium]|nr:hypothetical protein [Sedimentisphaerales bacterium]